MNFAIGFMLIFFGGLAAILGLGSFLERQGYSENEIMIYKAGLAFIVILIPPLLLSFGGRSEDGSNKLEQIGKPITLISRLVAHSVTPIGLIIFLLIIIINILAWK